MDTNESKTVKRLPLHADRDYDVTRNFAKGTNVTNSSTVLDDTND